MSKHHNVHNIGYLFLNILLRSLEILREFVRFKISIYSIVFWIEMFNIRLKLFCTHMGITSCKTKQLQIMEI